MRNPVDRRPPAVPTVSPVPFPLPTTFSGPQSGFLSKTSDEVQHPALGRSLAARRASNLPRGLDLRLV